jgi:hypothetical protein
VKHIISWFERILPAAAVMLFVPCVFAQDATQTDGDKYKTVLENDCVRVLEYRDEPGDKTQQHHHPPFVLYALSSFERTLTLPDGKVLRRQFKTGDVMWSEAQTHIGENVGKTPTHVLITELKRGPQPGQECTRR